MPTKRVPFTGVYNTRPGVVAIGGGSAIADIAIADMAIADAISPTSYKDTRFINCLQITQSDENARSKRLKAVKRPGFAPYATPAASSMGNAIKVWTGQSSKVMSCFGNTNSTLYDAATSKGTITGLARGITETTVSSTPTLVIASSDGTAWYYQNGGTVTQITDAQFPTNTRGNFAALGGYVFIMDSSGKVHNSDVNSVTAWTANSFFATNAIPDDGVGVVRHGDLLIAFCKTHFEVLRNAGNETGTPLDRINERTQEYGCASYEAIAQLAGILYFAGTSKGGNISIYAYAGGEPVSISTPEIEEKLVFAGPDNIVISTLGFYGRHFVVVCAATLTYVYCVEEKTWHEWSGTQLWHKADGVSTGSTMVNYSISKTSTAGKVFILNPLSPTFQDNGSTFTATIQTAKLDHGTNKSKSSLSLAVIGDRETSASTLSIQTCDDDYQNWSAARTIDLSTDIRTIFRCGRYKRRAYMFSHAANTPMGLEAIEEEYEVDDV